MHGCSVASVKALTSTEQLHMLLQLRLTDGVFEDSILARSARSHRLALHSTPCTHAAGFSCTTSGPTYKHHDVNFLAFIAKD